MSFREDEATNRIREEKLEMELEQKCMQYIINENWAELDLLATEHLEATGGKSFKGFFFLGVSLYKQGDYDNSIRAFTKAELINDDDS